MPSKNVTLGIVAVSALGIGYATYKFTKFKKDYQRAREEARKRRQDNWNSFVSGVKFSAVGGCVLLGIAGYYSLKNRRTDL